VISLHSKLERMGSRGSTVGVSLLRLCFPISLEARHCLNGRGYDEGGVLLRFWRIARAFAQAAAFEEMDGREGWSCLYLGGPLIVWEGLAG